MAPLGEPCDAYDSHRNQYHSTRILAHLEQRIQNVGVERVLGVTDLDLFVPGLNFVFGEARLPGRVGVVSTFRLKSPPRRGTDLLNERVGKEAVHEVGHMLGLEHCSNKSCVMYFSNTLADTDRKSRSLCEKCEARLSVRVEQ
jgi:archaemetzincin